MRNSQPLDGHATGVPHAANLDGGSAARIGRDLVFVALAHRDGGLVRCRRLFCRCPSDAAQVAVVSTRNARVAEVETLEPGEVSRRVPVGGISEPQPGVGRDQFARPMKQAALTAWLTAACHRFCGQSCSRLRDRAETSLRLKGRMPYSPAFQAASWSE